MLKEDWLLLVVFALIWVVAVIAELLNRRG